MILIILDAIVIGVDQTGLSMRYWLSRFNKTFIIIDKGTRVGDVAEYLAKVIRNT
jgi:hypothetical protein